MPNGWLGNDYTEKSERMAQSRKKRQIDGRLEILQNCDRGTIESLLPLFLTFIWDVEQYLRVTDSFLTAPYNDFNLYFKEKDARKKRLVAHLNTFYKIFCDGNDGKRQGPR